MCRWTFSVSAATLNAPPSSVSDCRSSTDCLSRAPSLHTAATSARFRLAEARLRVSRRCCRDRTSSRRRLKSQASVSKSNPGLEKEHRMGIGVSLILIAAGAILAFAVHASSGTFNVHTIGIILLVVGAVGVVLSMVFWSSWGGFGQRPGNEHDDYRALRQHISGGRLAPEPVRRPQSTNHQRLPKGNHGLRPSRHPRHHLARRADLLLRPARLTVKPHRSWRYVIFDRNIGTTVTLAVLLMGVCYSVHPVARGFRVATAQVVIWWTASPIKGRPT